MWEEIWLRLKEIDRVCVCLSLLGSIVGGIGFLKGGKCDVGGIRDGVKERGREGKMG